MENKKLFRKECFAEDIFMEGMDDYSRLPSPNNFVIRILIAIAILILLLFCTFHKIDISYYAFAYTYGDKMYVYCTNESIPSIDENTLIVLNNEHYKLNNFQMKNIDYSDFNDKTNINNEKFRAISKIYSIIEIDNPGLPNDVFEVKVEFTKKNLFDYIIEIGKK